MDKLQQTSFQAYRAYQKADSSVRTATIALVASASVLLAAYFVGRSYGCHAKIARPPRSDVVDYPEEEQNEEFPFLWYAVGVIGITAFAWLVSVYGSGRVTGGGSVLFRGAASDSNIRDIIRELDSMVAPPPTPGRADGGYQDE